jgi:SulP family sulfate permease
MVFQRPFLLNGYQTSVDVGSLSVPIGALLGVGSVLLLLLILRWRSVPAALMVVAVGAGVGLLVGGGTSEWRLGPVPPDFAIPSTADFWTAFVLLVVPQLPLTLANSVIATADAAKAYFPGQASKATPIRIAWSIALGNLWAGLSGGLPNCHGSGGLTAHYRLGARTPLATAFLGALLITVALLFGQSAWEIRSLLPSATLGALLFYVGVQHVLLGLNIKTATKLGLAALVAVVSMAFGGNLAIGATTGLVLYWSARWLSHRYGWRPADEGRAQVVFNRVVGALQRVVPTG